MLTTKEVIVLKAVIECGTVKKAASKLSMSHHTVEEHLDRIRYKTGLQKMIQVVAWAGERGYLWNLNFANHEKTTDETKLP